ncbi:MAG TPA: T9SS type A sorting domain-containing protein [Candidatus Binatia bacterium]|nr:T9SS type A sorting domain-containing protein [Candidatus Binatia bacterium]
MKSLKWIGAAALITLLAAPGVLAATRVGFVPSHRATKAQRAAQTIDNTGRMNVNNLDMVVTNHGSLAYDLLTGNAGLIYPRGTIKTAVFAAGLWLGALVTDSTGTNIRAAVGEYSQEYTPGPMAGGTFQSDNPSFHNFRIERGHTLTGTDLTDYIAQGGPLDSTGAPQLLGDATIWSVFNDADPGVHTNEAGSTPPLGIEVQQSVFAYNRSGALGNIIFVKWRFINKGSNTLDSTYVSVWSDPDLGGATDDLVGCDTTLSLGYCYNATNSDGTYGSTPPAVGYDFFKGPTVGGNPLGMTSFNKYVNGTDPSSQVETYNYMRGLNKDGSPIHVLNDTTLAITKFQVSGLNLNAASTATNWLDSNPGDRRLQLSSGPFTMAPGDTQEVVTAIIIGQGTDRISSVNDLKNKDAAAQTVFDLNFDIPQPPPSPTVYVQPLDRAVRLIWDRTAVGTHSANAFLGQDFVFEGYRVWQLPSAGGGTPKVIATFDQAGNAIGPIYSDLFNSAVGAVERTLVINGTDEGLRFQLDITNDAIRGGRLVNYKDYYFAVTAFSYDSLNVTPYTLGVNQLGIVSDVLESALNVVHAVPKGSNAIFTVPTTQIAGSFVGNTFVVQQVSPTVADSTYHLVVTGPGGLFSIVNTITGDTIVTNQTSAIVNGFTPVFTENSTPAVLQQLEGGNCLACATDSISFMPGPAVVDSSGTYILSNYLHYPDEPVPPEDYIFDPDLPELGHDFLIRVLPDTTEYAWAYAGGADSPQATFKVPFELYDLGLCSLQDPSDDVRITPEIRDRNGNGRFDWGDALYVRDIPYASVAWNTAITSGDYSANDESYGRLTFYQAPGSTAALPAPSRILIRGPSLCPGDVFAFRTVPAGAAPGSVVGNDLTKIRAVPNPYYAHSQYELSQFDRVLKFTNIPGSREVTIRIFNLAGDLVRTIRRSAQAGNDMSSSQISWDLNTENRLPVASGIYIARIEVAGIGATTLRIAVFVEQERLDNF